MRRPILTLLCALVFPAAAHGGLLVVGPGAYPTVQAAVDQAAAGDVVLVKFSTVPGFLLQGKGLSILAESTTTVTGSVLIESVPAGQSVTLRNLSFAAPKFVPLTLKNNEGLVLLDTCSLQGADGVSWFSDPDFHPDGYHALVASGCASVVLADCELRGGDGASMTVWQEWATGDGGHALWLLSSRAVLFDSILTGGDGGEDLKDWFTGGDGGNGMLVQGSSTVQIEKCALVGGDGNHGGFDIYTGLCGHGGDGGNGLLALDALVPQGHARDSAFLGGSAGLPGGPPCTQGTPGQGIAAPPGSFVQVPGKGRTLRVTSPTKTGQTVTLDYAGDPADVPVLFVAPGLIDQSLFPFPGTLIAGPTFSAFVLPPANPVGAVLLHVPVPALPPGVLYLLATLQALGTDTNGTSTLTSPARVLVLDPSL